jgi:hypothetical protein
MILTYWRLLRLLLVMVMPGQLVLAAGRNYYVDNGGDDAADGSRLHPWKTIARVNRLRLQPGDSLFFQGGGSFEGVLRVEGEGGSAAHPIWIGVYGQGAATIMAGDSSAVVCYHAAWLRLHGLRLVGAGRKSGNVKDGLALIECQQVKADRVDISGFQKAGLMIYASKEVEISRVYAHENGAAGISVEGTAGKLSCRDLTIVDCRADDNPGDPTNLTNHSGNGIVAGHCTNLLIDRCSATNNGWDMPRIGNGPVGIWCYEADSVIIQHCLAYRNKTSVGGADGGGFDLDGGVTNSVIQYCLSYGNQGAGYCIFQYWGASPWYDNIIRYNISEDDGGVSDSRAGLYIWNSSGDSGQFHDCQVYNNTIYNSKEAAISFSEKSTHRGFVFMRNIFVGQDSLIRGQRWTGDVFRRNAWWVLHGEDRKSAEAAEGGKAMYADPRLSPVRGIGAGWKKGERQVGANF